MYYLILKLGRSAFRGGHTIYMSKANTQSLFSLKLKGIAENFLKCQFYCKDYRKNNQNSICT